MRFVVVVVVVTLEEISFMRSQAARACMHACMCKSESLSISGDSFKSRRICSWERMEEIREKKERIEGADKVIA